ncbi:hypothetical protein K435DRAFT_801502 [Dendrothele bispora CBS 962.96]|uniref:Uncharacterized protein n=1 Tax=Dendrothele bispora (strain CBS 962.96) TaxID=1314807 RepID=A0A4S8LP22_DENBC|nr:hypothetical protein K435DRAFT_801502 [Dendrothele bispora CBS 962.96]
MFLEALNHQRMWRPIVPFNFSHFHQYLSISARTKSATVTDPVHVKINHSHVLTTTMVRGRPLSEDLRCSLIHMGCHLPLEDVVTYSGIPRRTVQHIFEDYRREGHVRCTRIMEAWGRARKIDRAKAALLTGLIRFRPDYYLEELREELEVRIGEIVDESTIWRALRLKGFTMKKVPHTVLTI